MFVICLFVLLFKTTVGLFVLAVIGNL